LLCYSGDATGAGPSATYCASCTVAAGWQFGAGNCVDPCLSYGSCYQCLLRNSTCGWCNSKNECYTGDFRGPFVQFYSKTCPQVNWSTKQNTCPDPCTGFTNCLQCELAAGVGANTCGWCNKNVTTGAGSCMAGGSTGSQSNIYGNSCNVTVPTTQWNWTPTCPVDPCDQPQNINCKRCLSYKTNGASCGWVIFPPFSLLFLFLLYAYSSYYIILYYLVPIVTEMYDRLCSVYCINSIR
jgi:hypothetical protein